MKRIVPLAAAFAMFACRAENESLPSSADVDRLEALLKSQPCIGSLDGWERRHRFYFDTGGVVSPDRIQFNLREAGRYGIQAGRQITVLHPVNELDIDDTPVKMAWGTFDRSQGKLLIAFCGQNAGG